MLLFFLCGPFVEDRWGRTLFARLLSRKRDRRDTRPRPPHRWSPRYPLVGASGAIAGVMAAFLILFFKTKIQFAYMVIMVYRVFRGSFYAPAYVVIPLWFAQQYYNAITAVNSPVAFWAHVGGFLFGLSIALFMKATRIEERYIAPNLEKKVTLFESHPMLDEALRLRSEGEWQRAIGTLKRLLKETPNDIDALSTPV